MEVQGDVEQVQAGRVDRTHHLTVRVITVSSACAHTIHRRVLTVRMGGRTLTLQATSSSGTEVKVQIVGGTAVAAGEGQGLVGGWGWVGGWGCKTSGGR